MSFEGYYQAACENKHYSEIDCYSFSHSRTKCQYCDGKITKTQLVDTTNGIEDSMYEQIEKFKKRLIHPVTIMSDALDKLKSDLHTAVEHIQIVSKYAPDRAQSRQGAEAFVERIQREWDL